MPINLSLVIVFHVKIQHKTTNFSFCVDFVLIKLPSHEIPKNNYCLNDTNFFLLSYCIVSCRWSKKCYPRPLYDKQQIKVPWGMEGGFYAGPNTAS